MHAVFDENHQDKQLLPAVKHGGGGIMICACFAATDPGHLPVILSTMNLVMYKDSNPMNTSDCLKKKGMKVFK